MLKNQEEHFKRLMNLSGPFYCRLNGEVITVEEAADPNYIQLDCDITGATFRYLKVKINETFHVKTNTYEYGTTGEFGMEELEVYVKKDEE